MLSSKIENAHWGEKTTPTRFGIRVTVTMPNVALKKLLQREILRCGRYSEDSEGLGLKITCNIWTRRWPNLT